MIGAIDTDALLRLIWVAPLGTLAISLCFSLIIVGVTKAADCRRANRRHVAGAYAVLSVVTTVLFLGGVVIAISLIAAK